MNDKLISLFEEVLQSYYYAEEEVIHERSGDICKRMSELDEEIKIYRDEFMNILKEGV